MSIFLNISAALDKNLSDMVDVPPVAWANRSYAPEEGVLYLRPTNLQGETSALTGTQDETVGVYQIDIFAPTGDGKNEAIIMADKIADQFAQDKKITYNSQTVNIRTVSRGTGKNTKSRGVSTSAEASYFMIMIEIAYYAYSARR